MTTEARKTRTVSISELKAHLSRYLDRVKAGEEVLITDRGQPVARLARVEGSERQDAHYQRLVREGRIRPPLRSLPDDFFERRLPEDPEGKALEFLIEERREGR